MKELKTFSVFRRDDKGGVSGTGRILDGVVFHTGWVVVCWRTDIDAAKHGHSNIGVYPSWKAFHYVHIEAHPENRSVVVYGRDAQLSSRVKSVLGKRGNTPKKRQ